MSIERHCARMMRFSLQTILILFSLAAVNFGAWQVSRGWGVLADLVTLSTLIVWAIGPTRLARMESGGLIAGFDAGDQKT